MNHPVPGTPLDEIGSLCDALFFCKGFATHFLGFRQQAVFSPLRGGG